MSSSDRVSSGDLPPSAHPVPDATTSAALVEPTFQYDAFISYSRKDVAFAALLESTLKDYKPPHGSVNRGNFLKVFRDESDMTGSEYYSALDRHLKNSRKLIVICSPNARYGSAYVDDEIRRFIKHRSKDDVVSVIIAGVPNNESKETEDQLLAFPEALCEALGVPLAVNYRGFDTQKHKIRKGSYEPGWYHLLAELYGRTRSEIEQRERKCQVRRLKTIFLVAGSIIVALTALTIFALNERNMAQSERQREVVSRSNSLMKKQPDLSLLLALEAYRIGSPSDNAALGQVLSSLQSAGPPRMYLHGHEHRVEAVAFSPDGLTIASGSSDHTVRLWDGRTGKLLVQPLRGHTDSVMSITFSPDSRLLASASADKTIRIWDRGTGKQIGLPLDGHDNWVMGVAFSPSGKMLASASWDNSVRLWNVMTGQQMGEPLKDHTADVWSVTFSPDGSRLASAGEDRKIRLWDVLSHQPIGKPLQGHDDAIFSVVFSPDGRLLASASRDRSVRLWNASTGESVGSPFRGHEELVHDVVFSPDSQVVASASRDNSIRFWAVNERIRADPRQRGRFIGGNQIGEPLRGHRDDVSKLAFSPDGSRLASASWDKTVAIWDLPTVLTHHPPPRIGEPYDTADHPVNSVAFSADGRLLASAGGDSTVRLWDAFKHIPIGTSLEGHRRPVHSVAFSPEGGLIASASEDGTVRLWNTASGKQVKILDAHKNGASSVAFSPDGQWLASGGSDYTVKLWQAPNWETKIPPLDHGSEVFTVAFSPDGQWLATGDEGGILAKAPAQVRLWNVCTGKPSLEATRPYSDQVRAVTFSRNGKLLASASKNMTVGLWDGTTLNPIHEALNGHTDRVWSVAFSNNGKWMASGSADGTVRLWDPTTGQTVGDLLRGHREDVSSLAFSPDSNWLVSGSEDGTVRFWSTDPKSWQTDACRIADRNMSKKEWVRHMGDIKDYHETCLGYPIPSDEELARRGEGVHD